MTEAKVRVGVRVRPRSSREIATDQRVAITHPSRSMVQVGDGQGDKSFTYDFVFPSNISQNELFQMTAAPMLQSFVEGYNVTILAYGQTGSGKTYTMGSEVGAREENRGLIPRFMDELFHRISQPRASNVFKPGSRKPGGEEGVGEEHTFNPIQMNADATDPLSAADALPPPTVTVSFLEIYGEDVYDLLNEANEDLTQKESLHIRDINGSPTVIGLTERDVVDSAEAMEQLRQGTLHRTTAATLMNTVSSRSHAVYSVTLKQTIYNGVDEKGEEIVSKLSFVDLAGSERLKRTGAEGQRMKEGIQINQGLLALGNVINALADEDAKHKKTHVKYRESKLTRLLQDALGGNSQTLFLACVSPAEVNVSETLSTLRYANRAKNIKNKPVKNTDPLQEELRKLQALARGLKVELIKQRFGEADDIGVLLEKQAVKEYLDALMKQFCGSDVPELSLPDPNTASQTPFHASRAFGMAPSADFVSSVGGQGQSTDEEAPHISEASANFVDQEEEQMDPEQDVKIIDKLLEMIKAEGQFEEDDKEHESEISDMETEMKQKEDMLVTLKKNVEHYKVLIEENDQLSAALVGFEREKHELMAQLEAQAQKPQSESHTSKAALSRLQERLKEVEGNCKRLKLEKHEKEKTMRALKTNANKCQELENSIKNLKSKRAQLQRQQKDLSFKHKSAMEQKNRELSDMRRRRRKEAQQVTKLENEKRKLETLLVRKGKTQKKTEEALKRNKEHLQKLLTLKKRERLRQSIVSSAKQGRVRSLFQSRGKQQHSSSGGDAKDVSTEWAPEDQKIKGAKFMLLEAIDGRVDRLERYEKEKELQSEYDRVQKSIAIEVEALNAMKDEKVEKAGSECDEDEQEALATALVEQEQRLEELMVKFTQVNALLSDLHLPGSPEGESLEEVEMGVLTGLAAPELRTLVWSLLDDLTDERQTALRAKADLAKAVERADAMDQIAKQADEQVKEIQQGMQYAQTLLSPTSKMESLKATNGSLQDQLESTRAENASLLERLKQAEAESQSLRSAMAVREVREEDQSGAVSELTDELARVWVSIGVEQGTQQSTVESIQHAATNVATAFIRDARKKEAELQQEVDLLTTQLHRLSQVESEVDCDVDESLSLTARQRLLAERWENYAEARQRVLTRVTDLQQRARDFSSQLLDTGVNEEVQVLLQLDVPHMFTSSDDVTTNTIEAWERSVRDLAVKAAQCRSEWESTQKATAHRLASMELFNFKSVQTLISSEGMDDGSIEDPQGSRRKAVQSLVQLCANSKLSNERLFEDSTRRPLAKELFGVVERHYQSRVEVKKLAISLLGVHMPVVLSKLRENEGLAGESEDEIGGVSLTTLRDYIVEINHCVQTSRERVFHGKEEIRERFEREEATEAEQVEYLSSMQSAEKRLQSVGKVDLTHFIESLSESSLIPANSQYMNSMCQLLSTVEEEVEAMGGALECIERELGKWRRKDECEANILKLDKAVGDHADETKRWETSIDPKRLTDKTGKGFRQLKEEEAKRKKCREMTEKLLMEFQAAMRAWDAGDGLGRAFRTAKLTERGRIVYMRLRKGAGLNSFTQLMHLESTIIVDNSREARLSRARISRGRTSSATLSPESSDELHPITTSEPEESTVAELEMDSDAQSKPKNPFLKVVNQKKSVLFPRNNPGTGSNQENIEPVAAAKEDE